MPTGWISAFTLIAAAGASAPPPPPACIAAEYRQFDFWLGRWDVYDPRSQKKVAESLIEPVYHGCGIRENWRPDRDAGGSLSIYLPAQGKWYQSWIDSQGSRAEFDGRWTGQAMVLEGDWPSPPDPAHPHRVRMTYTPNPDGSVLQRGQASTDGGASWTESFAFLYRHAAPAPPAAAAGQ